jgi:hypothetical protein
VAWALALPPPPHGREPGYTPDGAGLRAWLRDTGLRCCDAAVVLGTNRTRIYSWTHELFAPTLWVRAWLQLGAPVGWRPGPVPCLPEPLFGHREQAGWIASGAHTFMPPAGYCVEGRDFERLPGCARCAFRIECAEIAQGVAV